MDKKNEDIAVIEDAEQAIIIEEQENLDRLKAQIGEDIGKNMGSIFQALWRPLTGWLLGVMITIGSIIQPLLDVAIVDANTLHEAVLAFISLAVLRTFEKLKQIDTKGIFKKWL